MDQLSTPLQRLKAGIIRGILTPDSCILSSYERPQGSGRIFHFGVCIGTAGGDPARVGLSPGPAGVRGSGALLLMPGTGADRFDPVLQSGVAASGAPVLVGLFLCTGLRRVGISRSGRPARGMVVAGHRVFRRW